ncbi:unnamed protein product [Paramecium primaurelia]|uniref:Tetratricopeptide repeat protein n=1 Tax=Paramecium primaurelia TaxID=5886 RepID=A0A8S1QEC8_PARPR|nr:unnamed protein product [Paramecium primaurelia]
MEESITIILKMLKKLALQQHILKIKIKNVIFIDDLNKYVESVNQTFSFLNRGIRFKNSYQLFQIYEFWVNMRMQLFGQTKHQRQILKILIPYMQKVYVQDCQLDKALAFDSKHVSSLHEKGECLRLLKRYKESIQFLNKALSINQKHTFSLISKVILSSNLQEIVCNRLKKIQRSSHLL